MSADLTRNTFDPLKHYTRVIMQQGRVQLDSDWNEQESILLHYLRTLAADLIGPAAGPKEHCGFRIFPLMPKTLPPTITGDFQITLGRYYVDGILCEADSTPINIVSVAADSVVVDTWSLDGIEFENGQYVEVFDLNPNPPIMAKITVADKKNFTLTLQLDGNTDISAKTKLRRVITYMTQPDYPKPEALASGLAYLDVWERPITYVQDDNIREVALGGPDTTARTKLVWQVKIRDKGVCTTDLSQPQNRGRLKARAKQSSPSINPCIISPGASYTGPENQLYRIEIHTGGLLKKGSPPPSPPPTFKWSRENGAVFYPIISGGGTNVVTLENLGRDDRFSLTENDWVEVQDDWSVLHNYSANLLKVGSIDQTKMQVTLIGTPDSTVGGNPSLHPFLKRWDQEAGDPKEGGLTIEENGDGAAEIFEDQWLTLEDGVQILFQSMAQPGNEYRTGDYWLIPARTATGNVEWPVIMAPDGTPDKDAQGNPIPIALPPAGIDHHYAPLAVIVINPDSVTVTDHCQKCFVPQAGVCPDTP